MKVIDLLNKIANGEDVPEYIRYFNKGVKDKMFMFVDKENIIYRLNQGDIGLNDEIEIIEEDKKIEKLDISDGISVANCAYKINEIIDYLQSKGE